jgi:hypothetical protein
MKILKRYTAVSLLLALAVMITVTPDHCRAEFVNIDGVFFSGGVIPEEPLKFSGSDMEMRLLIVIKDPILLDQPNNDGMVLEFSKDAAPKYLDPLMAYSQSNDGEYFLVKTLTEPGQWGWIPREFVLERYEPLRAEEGARTDNQSIPNPAFIKVVAKNNWRTATGRRLEAVPILNGPGPEYDTVAKINIFRIRYAYDIRPGLDGKEYVLVGEEPSLNQYAANSGLSGWINLEYAILWTSRVGIYYNRNNIDVRRNPVHIFQNKADLEEFLADGNTEKAIAHENTEAKASLEYDTTRFPIIGQAGGNLLHIAFVGNAKAEDGSRELITNEELSRKRSKLNEIIDQTRNQDILFLIDATKSMQKHFPAVLQGLENFMGSIKRQTEKNRFRFAIAVYRDYQDVNNGFHMLANLGGDVRRFMKEETAYSIKEDHDFPEALYQGIIKSTEQADWGSGRTRAIIVIGDHGNHAKDIFSAQQAAKTLEEKNVAFYSINVNRRPETLQYNRMFDKQVQSILSLSGDIGKNFIVDNAQAFDQQQTAVAIEETLASIFRFASEVSWGFKDITEGKQIKEVEATYGTEVTTYLRRIMREQGLTESEINLANLSQICEEGWVAKKTTDGIDQLTPWVLIDRSSLDELVGIMSGLFKRARRRNSRGLGMAVTEIVKRASGDEINENERISQFLYRRFHIPYREVSDVLQYSPTQLEEKFQASPDFKKKFIKRLGKTYALLQSVQEEKSGELKWSEMNQRWSKQNPVERKWWWKTSTGMSFAWIPMDYMP